MKKLIILFCITLCFAVAAYGYGQWSINSENVSNPILLEKLLENRIGTLDNQYNEVQAIQLKGTGEFFYVDSGVGSDTYDGKSWARAKATLDAAVGLCTADRGDVIFIAQGHNESLDAADDADLDVAGITVIGCGNGTLRPTLDFDAATAGMFAIGAANIEVRNIIFRASTNGVAGLDIESAGDNWSIINCEFKGEAATDEFANAVIVGDTANDGLISGCVFKGGGQAAVTAIKLDADIVGITITNNFIYGDYSTACILGDEASDDIVITNNVLFNGTMGGDGELNSEPAIEVADSTAGLIAHNDIISDVATALLMVVADDCIRMHNVITDTDGDEFSGSFEDASWDNIHADTNSITGHIDG